MQISTGDVFELHDPRIATIPPNDLIELHGSRDQVDEVSRKLKLGIKELEKREARRRQQKASRKANR